MANGPGDPATPQTLHSSTPGHASRRSVATRSREVYLARETNDLGVALLLRAPALETQLADAQVLEHS